MRKHILGLAPFLFAASATALAAPPPWKVSEATGDVRLVQNGRITTAVKGALLSSGSTIATGANARAVLVRGEEYVIVSPRTQLRVPADAAPNKIMQLIEDFGTAVFKINKKSTPHFGVQTPYLAAVVKGTTFTVTTGPEGASVQVTEGAVQVSTLDGGAAELVRPGTIAMIGASDLFRLNVEGATSKSVRSPNAPEAAGSAAGPAARSAVYSGPPGQEVRVSRTFGEEPKSLKDVTKGLLEGRAMADIAQAEFREQARAAEKEERKPDDGEKRAGPEEPAKPAKPDKGGEGDKPADPAKPTDPKPNDPKPSDPKPSDPKPSDPKPSDPKPSDPKTNDPAKPGDPGKSEDPGKPGDLDKPEDKGKTTDLDKPEKDGPDKDGSKDNSEDDKPRPPKD
jgi:hypothetical protein